MIGVFFFFKQKTAYEMRISDWSSDVCSSDLTEQLMQRHRAMKDVAAGQRETSFEFERRQQLAMQDRCAEIWRVSVDRVDATFGECVTAFVPVAARERSEERRVGKECVRSV